MELEIMVFVISIPISVPIPMPRFTNGRLNKVIHQVERMNGFFFQQIVMQNVSWFLS